MSSGVARELAFVYLLIAAVTLLVSHVPSGFTNLYGHLLLATLFLTTSLRLARRDARGPAHYGVDLEGVLEAHPDEPEHAGHGLWFAIRRALPRMFSELGVALALCAVIFPPFALAYPVWNASPHPFTFHLPAAPVDFALTQLIAIALPEEAMFRGYFQTRLADLGGPFARTRRVLGAEVSLTTLTCQAALFALLHFLVGFSPVRLAVFFPGLLFGWLRALRGGIGAASWFHAFCNLLADLLTRGYL